mmetsp:Transcript_6296/g.12532  ORF Transcript_6296/g.12532 Transcript_6296/m.12532 type:complete len:84 (-) Transcript_6296:2352-2603(-)
MQNDKGDVVDMYIPRKCSATNRLIPANDHSSVQINIGRVDSEGRYTGEFDTMALCGFIRGKGLADDALYRLVKENDYLADLRQ